MTLHEGLEVLRVDEGANDDLILRLIEAIPEYISLCTGLTADEQRNEPLVKVAEKFILTLWYFGDKADEKKLNQVIGSILKCLMYKLRNGN